MVEAQDVLQQALLALQQDPSSHGHLQDTQPILQRIQQRRQQQPKPQQQPQQHRTAASRGAAPQQQQQQPHGAPESTAEGDADELDPQDQQELLQLLQAQRVALLYLARGLPVPPEVLERATAAGCSSSSTYPFDIPQVHPDGRPAALPAAEGGGPGEAAPTGAAASTEGPASGKAAAAVGASQGGGGDPHPRHSYAELQELQQRRLDAHIQHQVEVLQEAVTTLPQSQRLAALLQLKALRLRRSQQQLRRALQVQHWLATSLRPTSLLDWGRLSAGPLAPHAAVSPLAGLGRAQREATLRAMLAPAGAAPGQPQWLQVEGSDRAQALGLQDEADVRAAADKLREADEGRVQACFKTAASIIDLQRKHAAADARAAVARQADEMRDVTPEALHDVIRRRYLFCHSVVCAAQAASAASADAARRRAARFKRVEEWHVKAQKAYEKETNQRVLALKSHNYEEYLRLARSAKDDRLRALMDKTDEIMTQLGKKVREQQAAAGPRKALPPPSTSGAANPAAPGPAAASAGAGGAGPGGGGAGAQQGAAGGAGSEGEEEDPTLDEAERMILRQQNYYKRVHKIKEMVQQPQLLRGVELRSYQKEGLKFLVSLYNNHMNGILADEMGLGKTIQTVALLGYIFETKMNKGPHLILAPKGVLINWADEFQRWAPSMRVVVFDGTAAQRAQLAKEVIEPGRFLVAITHYDLAMREKGVLRRVKWEYLIVDEGHRLKNAESKLFGILTTFYFKRRLLLTGTPIQNSLGELWALLNFLLPFVFSSADTFDDWFAAPFKGQGEDVTGQLREEEQLLIINRLHQVIRPFMLRRTKREVEKELPNKTQHVIKTGLSAWQQAQYDQLKKEDVVNVLTPNGVVRKRQINAQMAYRQISNHPWQLGVKPRAAYVPGDSEELVRASGKLVLLDNILPKLYRTGHRCLLFSQFVQTLDILSEYLALRGYTYRRLDGHSSNDQRRAAMAEFQAPGSNIFLFIISTRAGALGLNLQAADTVVIFDSDWNPQMDQQAEDRAHRIGQKKEVLVLILAAAGTVDELILDKAEAKKDLDAKVIQAGMYNERADNAQRQQLLLAMLRKEDSEHQVHVHTREEVNKMLARSDQELELFDRWDEEEAGAEEAAKAAGVWRPPLMTAEEVPAWVTQGPPPEEREEDSVSEEGGARRSRRRAARGAGSYKEISEAQFIDWVEGGGGDMPEPEEEPEPVWEGEDVRASAPSASSRRGARRGAATQGRQPSRRRSRATSDDEDYHAVSEGGSQGARKRGGGSSRAASRGLPPTPGGGAVSGSKGATGAASGSKGGVTAPSSAKGSKKVTLHFKRPLGLAQTPPQPPQQQQQLVQEPQQAPPPQQQQQPQQQQPSPKPAGMQQPQAADQPQTGKEDGAVAAGGNTGGKKVTLRLKRPFGSMAQQPPQVLPQQQGQQQEAEQEQEQEQSSPTAKRPRTQEEGGGAS